MRSAVLLVAAIVCLWGADDPIEIRFAKVRPGTRVTFFDGSTVLGVSAVRADGTAALRAQMAPGAHQVRAIAWGSGAESQQRVTVASAGGKAVQVSRKLELTGPVADLAVADVNGDGVPDVVAATSAGVTVLMGRGNGDFDGAVRVRDGGAAAVAVCDFDGDGWPDIAVGTVQGVTVLRGMGQGTFAEGRAMLSTAAVAALTVADLTGDGIPDLAAAGAGLRVFPGTGSGLSGSVAVAEGRFTALAAADFDADGAVDLAAGVAGAPEIGLFRGHPGLVFQAAGSAAAGGPVSQLGVFTDSGGSGPHLLVQTVGGASTALMANQGGFAFRAPVEAVGLNLSGAAGAAADLNGDGAVDRIRLSGANGAAASEIHTAGGWTVSKTHRGTFYRGLQLGRFEIVVNGPEGIPELDDQIPAGLTVQRAVGDGWECDIENAPMHCFGYGLPDDNGDFPTLTVEVSVDQNAPLTMTNTVIMTDGGQAMDTVVLPSHAVADLTVTKTHNDPFAPGQTDAQFDITVSNVGTAATDGSAVTVFDQLPAGLSATSLTGEGWTCQLVPLSCTRSDVLANGASYPTIVLTTSVMDGAPSLVTNHVIVGGGGDYYSDNNTADDYAQVAQPDLTVLKLHSGQFSRGQAGVRYSVYVTNSGGQDVTGTTTLVEQPPAGLTITAMSGSGWSCDVGTLTCTNSTTLQPGQNYPKLTVTADVASDAPPVLTNKVSVSNATDMDPTNNSASDDADVDVLGPDLVIDKWHDAAFVAGATGTYQIAVSNRTTYPITDIVTVTETPPAGMTVTALSGAGWNCNVGALSCTAPVNGGVLPTAPITVTVNIDAAATGMLVNQATVSGGGDVYAGNNKDLDSTSIAAPQSGVDLTLAKTHTGNFYQGQLSGHYTLQVANVGNAEPTGTVTVTEQPPAGMTVTSMSSMVWTCSAGTCSTSAATYTVPISVTVSVDPSAPSLLTNHATVSTPGDVDPSNNGASDDTVIEAAAPDLTIAKSHSGDFARGQSGVVYTLAVTNVGNAPTNGSFTVVDTPPAGLTITGMSGTNWVCDVPSRTCTYPAQGVVGPDSAAPAITVTANVAADAAADFVNQATVSGGGDANSGNNTASDPTHTTGPNLRITKTHSGNFRQGQQGAHYTLTVTNVGDGEPTGTVTVTDVAPAGMTVTSMSSPVWTCNAGSCSTSPAAYTQPVTVMVNVDANAPAQLTNTATVHTAGDLDSSNNTASDPTTIDPYAPDLTITKTHSGNFKQGQLEAHYTLQVSNVGNAEPTGTVTVTEVPPPGMTLMAMSSPSWTCSGGNTCSTSAHAYGGAIDVAVRIDTNAPAQLTNTATVRTAGDSNSQNDSASDVTVIESAAPDLTIAKSHNGNFARGQNGVVYVLAVTNVGNAPTNGSFTVVDTPPAGLTITGMTGANWVCDVPSRTCTYPAQGVVGPNSAAPAITVTANVAADAAVDFVNQATVSGGGDANSGNNTASDPTHTTGPNLRITKTHSGNFRRGQQGAHYTLTVTNVGDGEPTGTVTVADVAPAGMTVTSMSSPVWTCNAGSCSTSPAAYTQPVTVTVNVDANAAAQLVNTATVHTVGDVNASNNTASDPTTIDPVGPDLTITKSHTGNFRQGQLDAHYTLQVANVGNGEPTGTVTVTEVVPVGMTLVSMSSSSWNCAGGNTCTTASNAYSGAITVTVRIDSNAPAQLINTATVRTAGDSNSQNDSASDVTVIESAAPDLTIAKSHSGNFARGQNGVVYVLAVTNVGNAPTTGSFTVVDTPPAGLTITGMAGTNWVCDVPSRTCTYPAQGVVGPNSAAPAITVTANVAADAAADFVNQATVSGGGDANSGNNTASDPTHTTGPNLRITKTHPGNFRQGQQGAHYTLTVTNVGDGEPTGTVTVADVAPAGMTVTSMSSPVWTCNAGSCSTSPAAYTQPVTVTVNVDANAPAQLTNTATVHTAGDLDSSNNTASDSTTIDPVAPDLTITKSHTGNFRQGQLEAHYTLQVSNTGTGEPTGPVTVTEVPPDGMTVVSMSSPSWTCSGGNTCSTSAHAYSGAIDVTVRIDANAAAQLTNTATVSTAGDSNSLNNLASDVTVIEPAAPDLTIAKSHQGDFSRGQSSVVYTIQVVNTGNAPTSGTFAVLEKPPAGLTVTGMAGANWVCSAVSLTCTSAAQVMLSPGAAAAPITVTANVAFNAASDFVNQAVVSGGGDATPGNNIASDGTHTVGPDLRITKTHNGLFRQGQLEAHYTIQLVNEGEAAPAGVVRVTEVPPAGMTVMAMSSPVWTCNPNLTCSTSAAAFGSPIDVMVRIDANAAGQLTNTAIVSADGDLNAANDRADDPTVVLPAVPDLIVNKSHTGSFSQGQAGAAYTISVINNGSAATSGAVTVTDVLPAAGLTVTGLGGTGWVCSVATVSCTRSDVLAAGAAYPPVTVRVNVAADAPPSLINQAAVSGGGELQTGNNSSADPTTIVQTTLNVSVIPGLPVLDRATGRYRQSVSIRNDGADLPAAALVLDNLANGVAVYSPSGYTAATAPMGSPYIEAGAIPSGSATLMTVEFTRSSNTPITYSPRVLGPGAR